MHRPCLQKDKEWKESRVEVTCLYQDCGDRGCEIQTGQISSYRETRGVDFTCALMKSSRWELMTADSQSVVSHQLSDDVYSDRTLLQISISKKTHNSKIIHSFRFCTRQHILLAHPARVGPGKGKQCASLSFSSETEESFFFFSLN